jgi:hypothetical protein
MYKSKSYEFNFFFLINKCILLFKYIDNLYQKEILNEIKLFINKLQEIFSKADFNNSLDKKNKILELLINYFEQLIDIKIYKLIDHLNKDLIINEVNNIALLACNNNEKKSLNKETLNKETLNKETLNKETLNKETLNKETFNKESFNNEKKTVSKESFNYIENNLSKGNLDKNNIVKDNSSSTMNLSKRSEDKELFSGERSSKENISTTIIYDLEKKINNKINIVFSEIENNIKRTFKDYLDHTQYVEYDLDKKFNLKLEDKFQNFINNYKIDDNHIKKQIKNEIDDKIKILSDIFNDNIQNILGNFKNKFNENEVDLMKLLDEKINNSTFNKNNFTIVYDKDNNEIKLLYCNDIITSTKINIKGLIGPKGPIGNKGDKGDTPIIRKIQFTSNNKMKMIVQESSNLYEVISDDYIPTGPQGPRGERGEPGKCTMDLKWNQDNVMMIDEDSKDSVVFLKSLSIGDKSHCLKDNSLAIAGGKCYQVNSVAIGPNSKTLDNESIAIFGSCIGKKAFAYKANNIDENNVQFGMKDTKNNYNIELLNLNSKEIQLDCDIFKVKANKYEIPKLNELDERIQLLEKKIVDIYKKI